MNIPARRQGLNLLTLLSPFCTHHPTSGLIGAPGPATHRAGHFFFLALELAAFDDDDGLPQRCL